MELSANRELIWVGMSSDISKVSFWCHLVEKRIFYAADEVELLNILTMGTPDSWSLSHDLCFMTNQNLTYKLYFLLLFDLHACGVCVCDCICVYEFHHNTFVILNIWIVVLVIFLLLQQSA